ncbi:MAG: hypothetical protein WAT58_00245 [Candidatus Dormiibacterota bacterium]
MKICESCVHRRVVSVDEVPMGVNRDNRRHDANGTPYYLYCSYFFSYPSANMRLTCSQHTPDIASQHAAEPDNLPA